MNTKTKTKATFEAPEGFDKMPEAQAIKLMAMWVGANPMARVYAIDGMFPNGLPVYLRSPTGKRADIHRTVADAGDVGIAVGAYLDKARRLGGGYRDLLAMWQGGFTPSSTSWGTPTIKLVA
jgi:hypothetical protein|tara:strand:- start:640 stop:1005 length:366 start_codon:yes stop_codon:yes gene_type:complete